MTDNLSSKHFSKVQPDNLPISVIIPAYNSERYIAETLDSVLSQTLMPAEIIVVDDGSTDKTYDIAGEYENKNGFRLIRQSNGGPAAARNTGVDVATQPWVAFLDADDIWRPTKLEKQWAARKGSVVIYTDRINFGATNALTELQSDAVTLHTGSIQRELMLDGNFVTMSSAMVNRDAFLEAGGFCTEAELISAEDWDLWIRLSKVGMFNLIKEPLVEYRSHPEGISKNIPQYHSAMKSVIRRHRHSVSSQDAKTAETQILLNAAFFAYNSRQRGQSLKLYLEAIRKGNINVRVVKQLIKCLFIK